nr:MAG TPA: hypothetical protein [Caudoviricetes sp.]DAL34022.1 MAG TPA_asm: hypothetical protein [Caudoviricetes sp.]DAN05168.1 MAG TPA: hypothetical protein [Caudoviricetes sp.]DAO58179.1 MAG TPA: hypothetical protein [Caudoviricetes sp.]DAQ68819.1 MAG TPA: hypothetical protein [Caudoviricetes sp.]
MDLLESHHSGRSFFYVLGSNSSLFHRLQI